MGLIKTLRHTFATYGIPDELSLEGGPEFVSHRTREFLHQWGAHQRLGSIAFPHSNCRPEVGVKLIKSLITGNVGKNGAINIDAFQASILQYWNTPDPTTQMSPAMCLFESPVKLLIPILPGRYIPHTTWSPIPARRGVKTPPHVTPREMERTYQDLTPTTSRQPSADLEPNLPSPKQMGPDWHSHQDTPIPPVPHQNWRNRQADTQEQKVPQEIHSHVPTTQTKVHPRGYCLPPCKSTP